MLPLISHSFTHVPVHSFIAYYELHTVLDRMDTALKEGTALQVPETSLFNISYYTIRSLRP